MGRLVGSSGLRSGVATLALVAATTGLVGVGSGGAASGVVRCSRGLVALTFDDGPSTSVTPELLDVLQVRKVPATFFVVGERVAAAPSIVRRTDRLGFAIGNHTWRHEELTQLSSTAIEETLRRTARAVRAAGARMTELMRPPYGLIDARVRAVVQRMGLTPVLWTIDPRDWDGISSDAIVTRVLHALHPDGVNLVLLHDGVTNSPRTLRAVPEIIRRARARGYCFAGLGADGRPAPPVPRLTVGDASVVERTDHATWLRFRLRLDRPTSRRTSVRVATVDGSARADGDYRPFVGRIVFPVGTTSRTVAVRVRGDRLDERTERLTLRPSAPLGLRVADGSGTGRIRDDDPMPGVVVQDAVVVEPAAGSTVLSVPVTLTRTSGRWVTVKLTTEPVAATPGGDYVDQVAFLTLAPGQVSGSFQVTVLADSEPEGAETFLVRVLSATHAHVLDATATVTIEEAASGRVRRST